MTRSIKTKLKSLLWWLFKSGQRLGVDILPRHFYSQVPDIAAMQSEEYWKAPTSMCGVAGSSLEKQVEFVQNCVTPGMTELLPTLDLHRTAIRENGEDGGYGPVEAEFLYCFIKTNQPPKVVQVGCGVSTSIILRAAADAGYSPEIVCVEPFPMPFLEQAYADGRIRLVKEKAQKVNLQVLTDLGENDLLFIDSTHTVKPGSEVNRLVLEVLPRLAKGVFVHFHDIYFPYDYKRDVLAGDLFFWSESTLLHAFLTNNTKYEIATSLSMIHYGASKELRRLIPDYDPQDNDEGLRGGKGKHFPSAIYLKVVG